MRKNIQYKYFLPLVILVISMLLQGCKDDVFNPEKVKAAYQDKFPVKNIDPAMDWKMTQQVRVNVSVSEDTGIDYTIRIYDKNPLISRSSAKLLAEGTANNTTVFTTVMDCPSVLTSAIRVPHRCTQPQHSKVRIHPKRSAQCRFRQFLRNDTCRMDTQCQHRDLFTGKV